MKKFLLLLILFLTVPVMAEELLYQEENINMTPQKAFSGYRQTTDLQTKFIQSNNKKYYSNEQQKALMMKSKSVKDLSDYSDYDNYKKDPRAYSQKPSNEDMMHVNAIQNGIQNMYMNF